MVKNSKNKFITITCIIAATATALLVAAIIVTDWVNYSTSDTSASRSGIFRSCSGSTCTAYSPLSPNVSTHAGCFRSAGDMIDRFNAVAGTILSGSGIAFIVVIALCVQISGRTVISPAGHNWISFFFALGSIVSLIGVIIYGATMSNWIGCGTDVCAPYNVPGATTSCNIGFSYIFTVVGTILFCLCALVVVIYTRYPHIIFPSGDVLLLVSIVAVLAIVLNVVGVATDSWLVIVPNNYYWGVWRQCTVSDCQSYPTTQGTIVAPNSAMCTHSGEEIKGRLTAIAVLLIFSAAGLFLVFLVFFLAHFVTSPLLMFRRSRKLLLMGFITLVLATQVTVLVLWDNNVNTWYLCGTRICDFYTGSCAFGISYGFNLTSICLTGFLLVFHIFEFNDWCCFEERFASGRQTFSIAKVLRDAKKRAKEESGEGSSPQEPTAQQAGEEASIALPEGNWEYDSVSGFYWCEELYLFYDPDSRQYYDPHSDQWINTEAQAARMAARDRE